MEDKDNKQSETSDQIRLLEVKFTIIYRVTFGISVRVAEWNSDKDEDMVDVTSTLDSHGTSANPITIDEEDVKGKAKKQETQKGARPPRSLQN
jgi:hypothetical protein